MAQIVISDVVSLRERYVDKTCTPHQLYASLSVRGKYQGIIGGTVALGFAIGPVIGGALSQKASWRVCALFRRITYNMQTRSAVVLLD